MGTPMMGGYGYGYGSLEGGYPGPGPKNATTVYQDARPGYDMRSLIAAANILARGGRQQQCGTCSLRPTIPTNST
jgi:hypothetical protein